MEDKDDLKLLTSWRFCASDCAIRPRFHLLPFAALERLLTLPIRLRVRA